MHAANKPLTNHAAHAAGHEVKFKATGDHTNAVHRAAHDDECIGFSGVFHRFFQPLRVLAAVLELERVNRQDFLAKLVTALGVKKGV